MTAVRQEAGRTRFALTPLEIAGGLPLGMDGEEPHLPEAPAGLTPIAAFEDAVRSALLRPPCAVTFSGGRDSSAALAVAMRLARDEGLEPPVAVTLRFLDAPGSREVEWQERVAAHVGLEDWIRMEVGDEVEYAGPIAQRLLLRHGVTHPAAGPLFQLQVGPARNGSLVTGYGGDVVVGSWLPEHTAEVRARRARLGRRDLPALAYSLSPVPLRRRVLLRRLTRQAWLTTEAHRAFAAARSAEIAARPARFDRFLDWEPRLRRSCALEASVERIAADVDAVPVHPFHDRRFLATLARAGGWRGFGGRTSVMRKLFARDLPDDVLARQSKANFALTYFRGHARAFARRWDGRGFDPALVDPEALRRVWLNTIVDPRSALAIQHAWLDSVARGVEQPPADVVERGD